MSIHLRVSLNACSGAASALWFRTGLIDGRWHDGVRLSLHGTCIGSIAVEIPPEPDDARHGILLPGVANLHSHAFQRGMAGLAEHRSAASRDSFWTWRDLMYRFANQIGPEELEAIAALAYLEMVEAGFVHVAEFHYLHHDRDGRPFADPAEMGTRLASAAGDVGIGITLLPVLYEAAGFGGVPVRPEQRRFATDPDGYARLIDASRAALSSAPGASVGVAPHSLRAVTPAGLAAAIGIAGPSAPIHIHIAEQVGEVEACLHAFGRRPVEWLLDHAPVDRRWCLVHATHASGDELERLARTGATVGLCPITEANLGDGIFPAAELLAAGGRFGVGSDSNVLIDLAQELRSLEYSQRLTARRRNVLATAERSAGRHLFDEAGHGAAAALGRARFGLRPGAPADFLSLDPGHPTLAGRTGDRLLDAFVFAGGRDMIESVWCAGRRQVRGGRHERRDAVVGRYLSTMATLAARIDA